MKQLYNVMIEHELIIFKMFLIWDLVFVQTNGMEESKPKSEINEIPAEDALLSHVESDALSLLK